MTKAYIQGFCKTAEAYGVDPDKLVKIAQMGPAILLASPILGTIFGGIPGLAAGKISQSFGGDRKTNAAAGAATGAAAGAYATKELFGQNGVSGETRGTRGTFKGLVKNLKRYFTDPSVLKREKALLALVVAAPGLASIALGGLGGAAFGEKKKGIWKNIKNKLGMEG